MSRNRQNNRTKKIVIAGVLIYAAAIAQEVDAEMLQDLDFYLNLEVAESLESDGDSTRTLTAEGETP